MNTTEDVVTRLFAALHDAQGVLAEAMVKLRQRPEVASVSFALGLVEVRVSVPPISRPAIDGYLDAELEDGTSVVWNLDATREGEGWSVERTIRLIERSVGHVQPPEETLAELPPVTSPNSADLAQTLPDLVAQLVQTVPSALGWVAS